MTKEELRNTEMPASIAAGVNELFKEIEELTAKNTELQHRIHQEEMWRSRLTGIVYGLKFAIRCNGVSGAEVKNEDGV